MVLPRVLSFDNRDTKWTMGQVMHRQQGDRKPVDTSLFPFY